MYSPDPTPTPARITLGPSTLRSGRGSGMSLYSIGGGGSLRASGADCGATSSVPRPNRPVVVPRVLTSFANVLTSRATCRRAPNVADVTNSHRNLARGNRARLSQLSGDDQLAVHRLGVRADAAVEGVRALLERHAEGRGPPLGDGLAGSL